jgi:dipeptidyl-peptidase 4
MPRRPPTTKWIAGPGNKVDDVPSFVDSASLIPRARDLHGYLMLMYGTYDDNVHPQNEEAFMNALIAAGKPYQV